MNSRKATSPAGQVQRLGRPAPGCRAGSADTREARHRPPPRPRRPRPRRRRGVRSSGVRGNAPRTRRGRRPASRGSHAPDASRQAASARQGELPSSWSLLSGGVVAIGVRDDEQPPFEGSPHRDGAILARGMNRVLTDQREWIGEHGLCLRERHAVHARVRLGLVVTTASLPPGYQHGGTLRRWRGQDRHADQSICLGRLNSSSTAGRPSVVRRARHRRRGEPGGRSVDFRTWSRLQCGHAFVDVENVRRFDADADHLQAASMRPRLRRRGERGDIVDVTRRHPSASMRPRLRRRGERCATATAETRADPLQCGHAFVDVENRAATSSACGAR